MTKGEKPEALEQQILKFIRDNNLIRAGEKILIAVSGGPDSMSLLYILYHLQSELDVTLHIAHLNHQLRGKEAETDAQYVAAIARSLNIDATIEKRDVIGFQSAYKLTLEEAAREVRYRFMAETADSLGINKVAVGHTQNDHVETILLHVIRGAGIQGLRGLESSRHMQFAGRQLTVIRPLLNTKREDVEKYCAGIHLEPCVDESNYSFSPLRNRIRQELLPLLRSYNLGISDSLLRIGNIASDELAFLEAETKKIWCRTVREEGNVLVFDKTGLQKLAPALQRQLLRDGFRKLLGTLKDIEATHIERILRALRKPAGKQILLPAGLVFSIEYDRYLFGKTPDTLTPFPQLKRQFVISVPGKTRIPGWVIEATVDRQDVRAQTGAEEKCSVFEAFFDKDKVGDMIEVRPRHRGDRFQPLGMAKLKRLGEFMIDARIPQSWRNRIPIFCTPQQIIWVAGWRIDERVKVTEDTRNAICLRLIRE
jgi:tRNA(Ile)-lysidine synthase